MGGAALGGKEAALVFSNALGTNVLMSYDGENEGQLEDKPLSVIFPYTENESKFPDWVINCTKRIHSRVGIC